MFPPRRGPAERALAWVFTGPLGHFWSVAADLAVYNLRRYTRIEERRKSP